MKFFDLHCDTLTKLYLSVMHADKEDLYKNRQHISLKKAKGMEKYCQFFAIWTADNVPPFDAYDHFKKVYKVFMDQLLKYSSIVSFCRNGKDVQKAEEEGKAAAMLSIEGGSVILGSLEVLREFYNLGARMMTLTWKGRNSIGDGIHVNGAGGLTPFGRMVVEEMERLGMIVDVSHISDKGFWDVAETAKKPFIASHSNSKTLCSNIRNLRDEQFKEIAAREGLVGLNFGINFIDNDKKNANINSLIKHVEHFMSLGGEKTLCMGSDFDGMHAPDDLNSLDKVYAVADRLLGLNYSQQLVDRIMYDNAMDFIMKWID